MAGIHVVWVGGAEPPWLDALVCGIADVFPVPVSRAAEPLDLAPSYLPARAQYHATLVLAALSRHRPDDGRVLGIVSVDLCIPVLTFVFGQAQLGGPAAVVSTYRLRPSFYGLPADEGLFVERTIKECVHELGHAFGLVHCERPACVMHASTSVDEVDVKGAELCGGCRAVVESKASIVDSR